MVLRGDFTARDRCRYAVLILPYLVLQSGICILVVLSALPNRPLAWTRSEKTHFHTKTGTDAGSRKGT
jgi:hypothetical protein